MTPEQLDAFHMAFLTARSFLWCDDGSLNSGHPNAKALTQLSMLLVYAESTAEALLTQKPNDQPKPDSNNPTIHEGQIRQDQGAPALPYD